MATLKYEEITIQDIIKWCKENNQVEWLKEKAQEKVECLVYPRKPAINDEGKKVSVADKSKEPTTQMRPITFVQIKLAFVEKFMPEIAPTKKDKEPNMYDLIAAL